MIDRVPGSDSYQVGVLAMDFILTALMFSAP